MSRVFCISVLMHIHIDPKNKIFTKNSMQKEIKNYAWLSLNITLKWIIHRKKSPTTTTSKVMNKGNCRIIEISFHRFQQTEMSICSAQKRQNARIFDQVVWNFVVQNTTKCNHHQINEINAKVWNILFLDEIAFHENCIALQKSKTEILLHTYD